MAIRNYCKLFDIFKISSADCIFFFISDGLSHMALESSFQEKLWSYDLWSQCKEESKPILNMTVSKQEMAAKTGPLNLIFLTKSSFIQKQAVRAQRNHINSFVTTILLVPSLYSQYDARYYKADEK